MLNFVKMYQPNQFNHYQPFFLLVNYKIPASGNRVVPTDAPYSEEPWSQPEKNRAALIGRLDTGIGELLEQLRRLKLESNTVVFFTSDTGPQTHGGVDPEFFRSIGPFRGGRGDTPYEGGLRVPMIACWPGKIPAGRISDFTWAAWDFLPTVMDMAPSPSPTNLDGISVLPALSGQTQTNRHPFLHWELRGRNVWHTVRLGDWEGVQPKADAPLELYDLKTDPGETNNIAGKYPDVINKLWDVLKNTR